MIATVTNYGDAFGVQFPKSLLKTLSISENDNVEIFVKDNSIILTRIENKKHFTTKERIDVFCQTMKDAQSAEFDWGKAKGNEIW